MNKKEVPQIIKEVGFDFWWDNTKVWRLIYPVEDIKISELEWHFYIPFWSTKKGYYDLKPDDVITYPKRYKEEYDRTMKTNLSYPIDIMPNKGRWLILDGLHRLVKAKIQGLKFVKVRKIPCSEIKNIRKVRDK
jgi:hypothetical protein